MASDVDICNLALGNLGNSAKVSAISPTPDGSVEAMHCARFYPIARRAMLELHSWGFATRRQTLSEISTTELPEAWAYAYGLPNKCIRPRRLIPAATTDDNKGEDFKSEVLSDGTKALFANVEDAALVFTYDEEDTAKFSPLFVMGLARLLASMLAGPLLKGTTGMKVSVEQYKLFLSEFGMAAGSDANARQSNPHTGYEPAGITSRK